LILRSKSDVRSEWTAAAEERGTIAAENAQLRKEIWEKARVNSLGIKFIEVPSGAFDFSPKISGSDLSFLGGAHK
jgi:hypothetical protein